MAPHLPSTAFHCSVAGIKLDPESLPADFREPSAADIARGGYEAKYVAPDYDESVVLDDVLDPKQNRDVSRSGLGH